MPKLSLRRPTHLFCRFDNKQFLDFQALLSGSAQVSTRDRILALSVLTQTEYEISALELQILTAVAQLDWTPASDITRKFDTTEENLLQLAKNGLLLVNHPAEPYRSHRIADEQLSATDWSPCSAMHHFMTKWSEKDLGARSSAEAGRPGLRQEADEVSLEDTIKTRGLPPPHFHSRPDALEITKLPNLKPSGRLYEILTERCTSRNYDSHKTLPLAKLSQILYYTFGCHGLASLTGDIELSEHAMAVKKTSPSGGALTPVECYPLITRVEGLDSGLYHYNVEQHALEQLKVMTNGETEALAEVFAAGQSYYRDAHVIFVLTARFYRNFWKYGNHKKAYKVLLMDAAHLSQTLYLLCTDMKLGAFVTAAINDVKIEKELKLNPLEEGVLCICGCGITLPELNEKTVFRPSDYDPELVRSG